MAIRKLRYEGDPVLGKVCKEVKEMTPHLKELVQDMLETMYAAEGVGLAAPQVGVLRRIAVIDVGEGPYVFVNPKIVETAGEQIGDEGCLSVPGKSGTVRRPEYVKTVAFDADMNPIEVEGHGLFARAMCHEFDHARCILHENDHLDGIVYVDKVEGKLYDNSELYPEEEQ